MDRHNSNPGYTGYCLAGTGLGEESKVDRDYLAVHPEAADTVEGIQHWWIRVSAMPVPITVVQLALERLELEGVVEQVKLGNRIIWRKKRTG